MKRTTWWMIGGGVLAAGLLVAVVFRPFPFLSAQALTEDEVKLIAASKYSGEIIHTARTDDTYSIEMALETGVYLLEIDRISGDVLSLVRQEAADTPSQDPGSPDAAGSDTDSYTDPAADPSTGPGTDSTSDPTIDPSTGHTKDGSTDPAKGGTSTDPAKGGSSPDPVTSAPPVGTPPDQEPGYGSPDGGIAEPDTNDVITKKEAVAAALRHVQGEFDGDAKLYRPSGQVPYYLVEVELDDDDREAVVQVDAYTGKVKSVAWEDDDDDDDDDD